MFKSTSLLHLLSLVVIIGGAGFMGNKYIDAINEKNAIEREKTTIMEMQKSEELRQQREAAARLNELQDQKERSYSACLARAQGLYDARAAEGPIFGDGPRLMMESRKRDCERIYGD